MVCSSRVGTQCEYCEHLQIAAFQAVSVACSTRPSLSTECNHRKRTIATEPASYTIVAITILISSPILIPIIVTSTITNTMGITIITTMIITILYYANACVSEQVCSARVENTNISSHTTVPSQPKMIHRFSARLLPAF